jgi:O-antigen ligase
MQRVLTYILVGVVFLITVLPLLVFDGLFFPFITSKAFVFRFLVEIGVGVLLLLACIDKKYIPRITPITVFFGLFVVVMLIADLFGLNVTRSIWSNFERMEGWIMLVHLFGLFVLFEKVLFELGFWKKWLVASLGVSVLVGIHGVLQLLGAAEIHQGGVRLDANFGNATYLAVYTLFHAFFAAWVLFESKGVVLRVLYGGVGVLNILLLYFSATRGALLGVVAGIGVSLFVYALYTRNKKVAAGLVAFVLFVGISFGALVSMKERSFVQDSPVLTRIASISIGEGETRFRIWSIALQGFVERPLLGWGQGNFNLVFSKHYNPALYGQEPWFDRAHNVFFDWLVAGGVLGLGTYLLLFGSLIVYLFVGKFSILERSILLGVLAGYGVNNLFVFDNLLSYIFFVCVAACVSSRALKEYVTPHILLPKEIAMSLIIIVGLGLVYVINIPALNANGALIRAASPQYQLEDRRVFFKEALSYNSFASQEIREQMVQLALTGVRSDQLSTDAKIALLADAAIEMEKQAELMPESARIHLLYGITLRLLGQAELAYEVLGRAVELAPHKQSVLFEYAFAAEGVGKPEETLSLLKKAHELDPSYEQARELYEEYVLRLSKE